MESLGGQPLSGIGFGIGIDRVMLACQAEGIDISEVIPLACFIIPLAREWELEAFRIGAELRSAGLRIDFAFGDRSLKGAMKAADKSGATFAFVLGERESQSGTVELKELGTGQVQSVRLADLATLLSNAVKQSKGN